MSIERIAANWLQGINQPLDEEDATCEQCGKAIAPCNSGAVVIAGLVFFLCWECLNPLSNVITIALRKKYPNLEGGKDA